MILIGISEKTKRECGKKKSKSSCYDISLENLGIRNLGNSIHAGCLKKNNNKVRYSRFILEKKNKYLSIIFERK